ncbi:MAG: YdcF family protein [Synechococcales bacterium]|nr:YdcF family protein [Synechococcales bacterium]
MLRAIKRHRVIVGLLAVGLAGWSLMIPLRIAIARHQAPTPQAILVLEGQTARIRFAANFARSHPSLPIWISGNPKNQACNQAIFREDGVPAALVHYELGATDTVTNFTGTIPIFKSRRIQHVYVITSDYHMARSRAIATLIFGSHGVVITPVEVASSGQPPESLLRTLRDCVRSLLWLLTGKSGASLRNVF